MLPLTWINYREICLARRYQPDQADRWPDLKELVAGTPQDHEEQIARYLESAPNYNAAGSVVGDGLDPTIKVVLFPGTRTDGRFMWPMELAYYVRKYHVRMPADFTSHMDSRNWQAPTKAELDWNAIYAACETAAG